MQNLWKLKLLWDEEIPDDLSKGWAKIADDLSQINSISFDRLGYKNNVTLIIFSDSSKDVYGFNCYPRSVVNGKWYTKLIFSKAKTTPVKEKTLLTCELLAVYLAFK